MWGGPERPGYWVYCLQDGKVAGRIFKQRTKGYRTEDFPDLTEAVNVPVPFDNLNTIFWKVFVRDDKDYLVDADANYCLNFWAYPKKLVYRIPLKKTKNRSTKIAMLCKYVKMKDINGPGQYFVSTSLKDWKEIELEKAEFETMIFEIPINLRQAENIYFKFIPEGEAMVGGFALI